MAAGAVWVTTRAASVVAVVAVGALVVEQALFGVPLLILIREVMAGALTLQEQMPQLLLALSPPQMRVRQGVRRLTLAVLV